MYTLTKQFAFEAAHSLPHLPADHPCFRTHGHGYRVEVVFEADRLDGRGFAGVDYRDLDPFKVYLDTTFDHRHLNDVLDGPTTAENIARHLFLALLALTPLTGLAAVRVSETAKTWAEYRPGAPR